MRMEDFKPSTFTTKKGLDVETKPHFATFNGKRNASKSKVFLILYHRRFMLRDTSGLGVGELHRQSGVNYDYIKSRVTKWVQWKYLERKVQTSSGERPLYVYSLAGRGQLFCEIIPPDALNRYIAEIREARSAKP